MTAYRIIDNTEVVLTTTDLRKAQEKLWELAKKYANKQSWFWTDEEELK